MRLLDVLAIEFVEFEGSNIPSYAILSHRWEDGEVTYRDMTSGRSSARKKKGFGKIKQCCGQAIEDGLPYVWVDTCCIDKSSSAELSEAINSMYQWYQNAAVCYAYLSDVHLESSLPASLPDAHLEGTLRTTSEVESLNNALVDEIENSKWWTRGWTLQELIAPQTIQFFGTKAGFWHPIGDKASLIDLISRRTGIHPDVLSGSDVSRCSIAMRMSWAADRETTRIEDLAYCLLGIFGVSMPLLYGEGKKAFLRLQEEIMKQSDDQTLFAWQLGPDDIKADKCGPLATSPSQFRGCSELVPLPDLDTPNPYSITNKGLRIVLPILEQTTEKGSVAILYCSTLAAYPSRIVLPLVLTDEQGSSYFARDNTYLGPLGYIELSRSKSAAMKTIFMRQEPEQMGGWRPGLRIKLHKQLHSHFKSTFFNPMIPTEEGDIQSWDDYNVPSDCRRGSILLSNSRSFVLILVDIELQHVGQYSCRVISNTPNWRDTQQVKEHKQIITNLGEETQQQLDTSALGTNDEVSATFQPADIAPSAGQRNIPYLHDCYTSGSNSRQSSCKLDGIGLVYASIAPQIIRGQSMLVLSIELHEPSRDHDPLCELEGSLGIISDRFAPGKMDTVPVLGRSYLQSLLHLRREGSS